MATSVFLLCMSNVSKSIIMNTHSLWDTSKKVFLFLSFFLFFFSIWHATLQNLLRDALSIRKSFEFEDLLQSSTDSCRMDWYAQSRLGLTRTLSEENVYEDIIGKQYTSHFHFSLTKWIFLQTAVSVKTQVSETWFRRKESLGYKLVCTDKNWKTLLYTVLYVVLVSIPSYTAWPLSSFLISEWVIEFSRRGD